MANIKFWPFISANARNGNSIKAFKFYIHVILFKNWLYDNPSGQFFVKFVEKQVNATKTDDDPDGCLACFGIRFAFIGFLLASILILTFIYSYKLTLLTLIAYAIYLNVKFLKFKRTLPCLVVNLAADQ